MALVLLPLLSGSGRADSIGQPNASLVVDANANQLSFGSAAGAMYQYFSIGSIFDTGLPTLGNSPGIFLSTGNTMNIPTWDPQLLVALGDTVPGLSGLGSITSSQDAAAPEPRSAILVTCGLLLAAWRVRRTPESGCGERQTEQGTGPPTVVPLAAP